MNSQPDDDGTLLVVKLKSEQEQLIVIMEILRQLDIPAEVMHRDAVVHPLGPITLRIPRDRVVAAVLALEHHGFSDVRAYEARDP